MTKVAETAVHGYQPKFVQVGNEDLNLQTESGS